MFKYLNLITFANLFCTLKQIAFLKHRACVLLAEASLHSIPPNVVRSGSLAPGSHPLPAQWPHSSLSITTLPKMVKPWRPLYLFLLENHRSEFLETSNVRDHQHPPPGLMPSRVVKLSRHCRGLLREKLTPFPGWPRLSVTNLPTSISSWAFLARWRTRAEDPSSDLSVLLGSVMVFLEQSTTSSPLLSTWITLNR